MEDWPESWRKTWIKWPFLTKMDKVQVKYYHHDWNRDRNWTNKSIHIHSNEHDNIVAHELIEKYLAVRSPRRHVTNPISITHKVQRENHWTSLTCLQTLISFHCTVHRTSYHVSIGQTTSQIKQKDVKNIFQRPYFLQKEGEISKLTQ